MKKIHIIMLAIVLASIFTACTQETQGQSSEDTLNIAYQYGMAYAPFEVIKEKKLIEKYYPNVKVNWQILNSGSAITEGMASGSIDIGTMGLAPAITAISKGVPCKIVSGISSQPHKIMCNISSIKSLSDITKDQKISVVNIGSIQHIMLAMAAERELGDAHALDNNLVTMAHPDGMASLISGTVACQVTTSPYIFKESEYEEIRPLSSISDVWPEENTFIVALASSELHDENPELFQAVIKAFNDAIEYINNNEEEVAEMLCKNEGVDSSTMLLWMQDPACKYSVEVKGLLDMAIFMEDAGFVDNVLKKFEDYTYNNVKGN